MTRPSPIQPGERAPDFVLPRGPDARDVRLYGTVGGPPAVLLFAGADGTGPAAARLRQVLPPDTPVHVVTRDGPAGDGGFVDTDGRVHQAYGVDPDAGAAVVLDPNVRVAAVHAPDDVDGIVGAVRAATHDDAGPTVVRQAPVLLVPDAMDADLCARLVDVWTSADTVATGVEATSDGGRHEQADDRLKRRRDHTVTDPDLLRTITDHVGRRVMPELQKAFAYRATRFEGFKIGGYEASTRGFFDAHRDNLSPATAHRRFALTLNLNDDYDGGELRFPEYGPQRYRPAAGEALVFSGSHLHEVLPVTRGLRLVLLSFLFGDDARRR